jgi:hypothetical protein
MELERNHQPDENALPAPVKGKGLGQRRKALSNIPLAARDNLAPIGCKAGDSKDEVDESKNKQPVQQPPVTKKAFSNPAVIVKPVNGTISTISSAVTAAAPEFSIFCDEELSDDGSQDEPLNLSLTSTGGKGDMDCRANSTISDVMEAVGMHDRALRELNLNSSVIRSGNTSLDDVFGTPASMRTAGKSSALMSELDMSIDAENIEPVCKKGRLTRATEVECFPDYAAEILKYLLDMEKKYAVNPNYMEQQPEINHKMRLILIDWLVEVMDEYKLEDETLFLAVNFVDRYVYCSCFRTHSYTFCSFDQIPVQNEYCTQQLPAAWNSRSVYRRQVRGDLPTGCE